MIESTVPSPFLVSCESESALSVMLVGRRSRLAHRSPWHGPDPIPLTLLVLRKDVDRLMQNTNVMLAGSMGLTAMLISAMSLDQVPVQATIKQVVSGPIRNPDLLWHLLLHSRTSCAYIQAGLCLKQEALYSSSSSSRYRRCLIDR